MSYNYGPGLTIPDQGFDFGPDVPEAPTTGGDGSGPDWGAWWDRAFGVWREIRQQPAPGGSPAPVPAGAPQFNPLTIGAAVVLGVLLLDRIR